MKLLVTGKSGQLVSCLALLGQKEPGLEVATAGRPEFDLARPEGFGRIVSEIRPDVVVSAAAYTAVDKAEDETDLAEAINVAGAAAVAAAAHADAIPVIHISTDYVFSGDVARAYLEADSVGPTGVYGRTKLAGEAAVAAANPRHAILRTAWVYSIFGGNFLKTMLRLAKDRDEISVVGDQWGNPTSAHDLAEAVVAVARKLVDPDSSEPGQYHGVFHVAGAGHVNWSGFARRIMQASAAAGGPTARIRDIGTADYPTKAQRPANSRLDCGKAEQVFGVRLPPWETSTDWVVARLLSETA